MLLGLIAGNATGIKGISVYVMVYTFMNLGAFLVGWRCAAKASSEKTWTIWPA